MQPGLTPVRTPFTLARGVNREGERVARNIIRGALAAGATCALGVGQAQASTLVGSSLASAPDNHFNCGDTCTQILLALEPTLQAPGGIASPLDGVVVRWRIRVGGSPTAPTTFRIARPAGGPGQYTGAGTSPVVIPALNQTSVYDAQMPISAGDRIGIESADPVQAYHNLAPMQTGVFGHWGVGPAAPLADGGAPRSPNGQNSPYELLVQAEVEPDCDGDGFGDETQDPSISSCHPRALTLDASKNKVKRGRLVTLSGQIAETRQGGACAEDQPVALQRKKPSQATFTTVEQLQTDATGGFSSKRKVKKTFEYLAQVAETATCGASLSNTEKVKVKKKKKR
jgi:hypothetical protein